MEKTKILTERLIIRNYEEKDLNDLYEYLSDEEVVRFEPYTAINLDDVKKNLEYVLNRNFWGNGYAFEACSAMCGNVFSKGIHRLESNCNPNNAASWKLLERLDFVREGHLRKNIYFRKDKNGNPIWKDTFIYSKLNDRE